MGLSTGDLERLRVADVPDFGHELALGGALLAERAADRRLAGWRMDVARGWNRNHGILFDLYTQMYVPGFFDPVVSAKPSGIDPASPAAASLLRDLALSGALTPFTRALADGHPGAVNTLNGILTTFRARALDPYRRRITSVVATASATANVRAAIGGIDVVWSRNDPCAQVDEHMMSSALIGSGERPPRPRGRALLKEASRSP
jgi:hypothetical protein